MILPISASQVARISGVTTSTWLTIYFCKEKRALIQSNIPQQGFPTIVT
jgi:hypothetical protein